MRRLNCLLVVAVVALIVGARDTAFANNGHSVPPANYSWQSYTQPWLCDAPCDANGCWNPMVSTWPQHGHCTWQPDPNASVFAWNIDQCWGGTPTAHGSMDIYSGPGYTGACARIYGLGAPVYGLGPTAAFQWDSDLVQVYGWLSIWIGRGGRQQVVSIQSFKVAPYTGVVLCSGPFTGPANQPCQVVPAFSFTSGPLTIGYPDTGPSLGYTTPMQTAAIQIGALQ